MGSPGFVPGLAIVGDGVELVVFQSGDDDAVANGDRRRNAGRDGRFPFQVFVRAEFGGRLLVFGDTGTVRASEARPIIGGECGERDQKRGKNFHGGIRRKFWRRAMAKA